MRRSERMADWVFRAMCVTFDIVDFICPNWHRRIDGFGLKKGMTVVDYGCGPGRYTVRFAKRIGPLGKVYAIDIHELAIEEVKRKSSQLGLKNIKTSLAKGYNSGLPDSIADVVCAIDMFFGIQNPASFLRELHRIVKPDGFLIIDNGHQSRQTTREKLAMSPLWRIEQETKDHLRCRPV
nr:class I SAM-dependent methyltransferase [uncultured Dethiosulfovibrio sp.]